MLGARFESEIREQPAVWRALARTSHAEAFARAVGGREIVLVGSGSSLFVAMLAALALRRRGIVATALAATEAHFERRAYRGRTVVAFSQSGRSTDVLRAVDALEPARLVALTNDGASPLAARAECVIDIGAGPERAVPASKSVTAMVAIVLWGAALTGGPTRYDGASLVQAADAVERWLARPESSASGGLAEAIARRRSVAIVGAGYGVPIALELALKLKEASYVHAEGFAAGEFRHGSTAMLDATSTLLGLVDDASRPFVRRPLDEARSTGASRATLGGAIDAFPAYGAPLDDAFAPLAWLVAGQVLALEIGRARRIDGDAPRGLTKFVS